MMFELSNPFDFLGRQVALGSEQPYAVAERVVKRAAFLPVLSPGLLLCYQGIMIKSTVISKKKRGPPATGKGEPIVVRMQPPSLASLDAWISKQKPPFPSRPEAIRRLVELGLKTKVK
jgi:hypothetical protein